MPTLMQPPIFRRNSWKDPEWFEALAQGKPVEVDKAVFCHFAEQAIHGRYGMDRMTLGDKEILVAFCVTLTDGKVVAFWRDGEQAFAGNVGKIE